MFFKVDDTFCNNPTTTDFTKKSSIMFLKSLVYLTTQQKELISCLFFNRSTKLFSNLMQEQIKNVDQIIVLRFVTSSLSSKTLYSQFGFEYMVCHVISMNRGTINLLFLKVSHSKWDLTFHGR